MIEAIAIVDRLIGRPMRWTYSDTNRIGDHVWWISDLRKFSTHYPEWTLTYSLERTIEEIHAQIAERADKSGGR
jgi:CDP-paratose 2-epimerase